MDIILGNKEDEEQDDYETEVIGGTIFNMSLLLSCLAVEVNEKNKPPFVSAVYGFGRTQIFSKEAPRHSEIQQMRFSVCQSLITMLLYLKSAGMSTLFAKKEQ